uniref:Uncharacterized protein n=1 Tax=Rhizophora mucronata TaxID=61149 RepID=A0A2P2JCH4_RHIMU
MHPTMYTLGLMGGSFTHLVKAII